MTPARPGRRPGGTGDPARTWRTRPGRPGLSRFPVFRGTLDSVVGTAHVKDVLAVPAERRTRIYVSELMREPLLVPETLTVDRLLDRLSGKRTMAVVIDEYGGTAGVATLEDIVEEVVGEVRDEHDPHETPDLAPGRHGRGRATRCTRPTAPRAWTSSRASGCGRRRGRTRHSPDWWRRCSAGSRPSVTRLEVAGWRWTWWTPRAAGRLASAARAALAEATEPDEKGGGLMTAVQLLIGLATLVVNAFFVGAEFALISVRRSQIEPLRRPGRPARQERAVGPGARVRADGGRAARHHAVHAGAGRGRGARDRAPAGAGVPRGGRCPRARGTRCPS